nr:mediator of RNA polymerase II transcription subunit 31 [Tanacetum cinerariifolium]
MNAVSLRPKKVYKDPDYGYQRIQLELELVSGLANPTYIRSATPKLLGNIDIYNLVLPFQLNDVGVD